VFRKRKDGGDQGYDRISRLVEERQRELAEGSSEGEDLEEDTIILHGSGTQPSAAPAEEERPVSLFNVRGGTRPEPGTADSAPAASAAQHAEPASSAPLIVESAERDREPEPPTSEREPAPDEDATFPLSAAGWQHERAGAELSPMAVPDVRPSGGEGTLVAANAVWEGKLRSAGDVRVEGIVEGEIDTAATLVVAPGARVQGTIHARDVMIAGEVEGDVMCEQRLEVLPGGSARGEINSGTLVVDEGAYIDSRFQMRREAEVR